MTSLGQSSAPAGRSGPTGPLQVAGEVLSTKRVGDYSHLTLVADGVAERTRPGSFVALAVGGRRSASLLRRPFWIHRVRPSGAYGGTVEVVVSARGWGSSTLAELRAHDAVDLLGPLGRPFALPKEPVTSVLVGDGYGSAPLFLLAERLRARGCAVHMLLGAETESRLFGTLEARRTAKTVTVATVDGSVGLAGRVTDALPDLLERTGAAVVYACGATRMLATAAETAARHGAWSQCALEQPMACGTGLCMTCVVPVVGDDGISKLARGCVEGPVMRGDQVLWEAL
jgi:dihydroorotate dehydrogenase electron transfer subunit